LLSKTWPGYAVPFEVVRGYDLPAYVNANTLVIAASYSGNTEETLSALHQAAEKGAVIAVIAGGGKLLEEAQARNYPYIQLPKAEQPRYEVLGNLRAIVTIAEAAGVLKTQDTATTLAGASEFLKTAVQSWLPTVPTSQNPAKQLAQELMGKSPVIYGGPLLAPAAYKWKICCNENAKNVAWWGELPEFNHNEFIGWSSHPPQKPYAVVDLRSSLEHERVQKRFEVSDRMLSGLRPAAHVVQAQGSDILQQLLWTTAFGDFVTIYLGLLNGVNPSPVELVERFKKELG
jgi:glucose/mannose-6-phosphate isomerase